jgi:hypothetical protein
MKKSELNGILRVFGHLVPPIKEFVEKKIAAAVHPLIERIKELEQRPQLQYEGVWMSSKSYAAGACVTHDGCLFIAKSASVSVRPGHGGCWQMAVKSGRDGRDARP